MRPNHIYHVFPLGASRICAGAVGCAAGRNCAELSGCAEGCYSAGENVASNNSADYRNIRDLTAIIPHLQSLRADSIMLGPVFKSETHGYDVTDMYQVDPRLGNNEDLKQMVLEFHEAGFHVHLDAVWNHSSRHHFAYRDLREKGRNSPYAAWYRNPRFDSPNLCGDSFTVDCWAGFQELPAFNLKNSEVEQELIHCAEYWMDEFDIDGIRLDAAENMDLGFLKHLADACHRKRPDFWMMGEVVFGDPRRWLTAGLNSVTNYQTYKSLWSSINDKNMFELAYNLNQLFDDKSGTCRNSRLQLFNENHDVSRIYSMLKNKTDNFVQHLLFYTLPGVPTLYYGEEFGLDATKGGSDDWNLRPAMHIENGKISFGEGCNLHTPAGQENLLAEIRHLASIRLDCNALRDGGYQQEFVHSQQLAFWRTHQEGDALIMVNLQDAPVQFEIDLRKHFGDAQVNRFSNVTVCEHPSIKWKNLLNSSETFTAKNNILTVQIPAKWGCILVPSGTL